MQDLQQMFQISTLVLEGKMYFKLIIYTHDIALSEARHIQITKNWSRQLMLNCDK